MPLDAICCAHSCVCLTGLEHEVLGNAMVAGLDNDPNDALRLEGGGNRD